MLTVCCWLWRDEGYRFNSLFRYGPEHVNTLAAMVRRNLDMDYEFACITDDPAGLDPSIRVIPLWDDLADMGGCYRRLKAFAPEMADIIGPRFVWLDVDCVVTGDLTPLFRRREDFVIWSNGIGKAPYCGSMVMMTAGSRACVWDEFDPEASPMAGKAMGYVGTDQAWIAARLPGEAVWTPDDGVLSRYHVGIRVDREKRPLRPHLPANARAVFLHGPVDPSMPELQARHPWIAEHYRT